MTISQISFFQNPSDFADTLVSDVETPSGRIRLTLVTHYSAGGEKYSLSFDPRYIVGSQQIMQIVLEIMPNYPNCSIENVDMLHKQCVACLQQPSFFETARQRAIQFLFAHRIILWSTQTPPKKM